jgi:catechol 2,3-dioxygenase-like lactoylglutathione lyase family enzyme
MNIERIHHVAYRCKDAKETVDWYVKHLALKVASVDKLIEMKEKLVAAGIDVLSYQALSEASGF